MNDSPREDSHIRVDAERPEHAYPAGFSEARLDALQRHAFEYFLRETNREGPHAYALGQEGREPGVWP